MVDDYESLLESAYFDIKPCEFCDRFEIKKVEGMHEGTKTVITNFSQIVVCLRRSPEHIIKFLSKELASPGVLDKDRLVLNRKLASSMINDKIQKYVEMFVKCEKCGKPDTEIVSEGGKSYLKCMACGTKKVVYDI